MNPLPALYAKFFGLQAEPFSIAPDPRYLFMSERHRDALAHLLYGLRGGGGFVLLTGEIGAGKTTVCRCFLEQIPENCRVGYIFNPKLTVPELLRTICDEFHIEAPAALPGEGLKPQVDALNAFLLERHAAGENAVLIIDEAQNLAPEVLEQLRLLTNLETSERKLLQIILIGQPELREMLARPELEQLAQRVIARFHLGALALEEIGPYVRHRLAVAGHDGAALPFDTAALARVHELSRGVPRRINLLCDRALLGAYAQGRKRVDLATLEQAAGEVFEGPLPVAAPVRRKRGMALGTATAVVVAIATAGFVAARKDEPAPSIPVVSAVASAPASSPSAAPALSPSISLGLLREADAWKTLATRWQADAGEDANPCAALRQQDLQCFKSDGGLALVRQLDRPGILTLRDQSGQPVYVLLVALNEQTATVQAGASTQTVSLLALSKQWTGEFATLWRTPPGARAGGMSAETADWLALHLSHILGEPAALSHSLDAKLQAQVAAFQRSQGLRSDGRPGPVTFMQVNRAAGVLEPRLAKS